MLNGITTGIYFTVKNGLDGSGGGAENSTWTFKKRYLENFLFTSQIGQIGDLVVAHCCLAVCHVFCQVVVIVKRQRTTKVPSEEKNHVPYQIEVGRQHKPFKRPIY